MATSTSVKRASVHFLTLGSKGAESTHRTDELSYLPKQGSTKSILRMVPGITPKAHSDSVRDTMDYWGKKKIIPGTMLPIQFS